jgi:plasmid stabilization system protein ParE
MVGHIMRLAAYLCTSRHGIFYFRFPIPADSNRGSGRSHIKLSLGTRDPNEAKQIARALGAAGQSLVSQSKVRSMRYDEMRRHVREHFSGLLQKFRERSAETRPPSDVMDEHALRYLADLAQTPMMSIGLEFTRTRPPRRSWRRSARAGHP